MSGMRRLLALWKEVELASSDAVLATVVGVTGSAYRRPGARLLLTSDGRRQGSVSGGCLERDLIRRAFWLTEAGPAVRRYEAGSPEDGAPAYGLGCNGVIEILLERVGGFPSPNMLSLLETCRASRLTGAIMTVIESGSRALSAGQRVLFFPDGLEVTNIDCPEVISDMRALRISYLGRAPVTMILDRPGRTCRLFVEPILPPPHLAIFGAGDDAAPLASFASQLDWFVTVAGPVQPNLFPEATCIPASLEDGIGPVPLDSDTMVVLMTHNYAWDGALLRQLLRRPLRYLGVLGPRQRTGHLMNEIALESAASVREITTLHGPVGLDIGGDTPEAVALSIVAEMQAVLSGREGGKLTAKPGSIHGTLSRPDQA